MERNDDNSTDKTDKRKNTRDRPLTKRDLLELYQHVTGAEGLDRRKPHSSVHFNTQRLARSMRFRDVIIPAIFHYLVRYTRHQKPADEFERRIFDCFSKASPKSLEFARSINEAYKNISQESRDLLFDKRYTNLDESTSVSGETLRLRLKEELERLGLRMIYSKYQGVQYDGPVEPGKPV
jgi:hypothetical protein